MLGLKLKGDTGGLIYLPDHTSEAKVNAQLEFIPTNALQVFYALYWEYVGAYFCVFFFLSIFNSNNFVVPNVQIT